MSNHDLDMLVSFNLNMFSGGELGTNRLILVSQNSSVKTLWTECQKLIKQFHIMFHTEDTLMLKESPWSAMCRGKRAPATTATTTPQINFYVLQPWNFINF